MHRLHSETLPRFGGLLRVTTLRFELIDRVLEREDSRLVGIKCLSRAEEYLADHFPGFAVFPGVLMLEALVQAGRLLLDGSANGQPLVLCEARNIRYGQMVRPGQTLRIEVKVRKQTDMGWDLDGRGTVGGEVALGGRFVLKPLVAA